MHIWACVKQSEKTSSLSTMFALLCLLYKFVGVGLLKASANIIKFVFTGSQKE